MVWMATWVLVLEPPLPLTITFAPAAATLLDRLYDGHVEHSTAKKSSETRLATQRRFHERQPGELTEISTPPSTWMLADGNFCAAP